MPDNDETNQPTPLLMRMGFVTDNGTICSSCLKEGEDPFTLPWLFDGEHFSCVRCGAQCVHPSDGETARKDGPTW